MDTLVNKRNLCEGTMENDAHCLLKSKNENCIQIKGSNKLKTNCLNTTTSEEIVDQGRRHDCSIKNLSAELRKQLKLLKLSNMKMKKQLRSTLRVRFLNRIRLEREITQLNCLVSKLRTTILGRNDSILIASTEKVFSNPESARFFNSTNQNSNTNQMTKLEDSPIYTLPVKRVQSEFKFFCDQCDFKCKKKTPFDIHVRRHSGERPFSCEVCGKTFVAKYELKLHAAKHIDGKKYHCDECDYVTYRPDMLVHHREKHSGLKTHCCNICGFKTDERSTMVSHRKTHPEADPLPCLACEKVKNSTGGEVTDGMPLKSSDPSMNCRHAAPSNIKDESDVNRLSSVVNKETREVSNDLEGKGKKRLRAQKHTCDSPWSCEICGRFFKKRESLTKHTRTHTGERPFRCDRCSYSAATKHTLVIHLRKHSGEKPYSCDQCSFSCTTKGYLNIHLNNHKGIKPFACQLCPYRSVDSCKLAAHKRARHGDSKTSSSGQHSFYTLTEKQGDLPYICTLCKTGKRFAVESVYKRHLARHRRSTLSCQLCDYTTTVGKDLKRHLKIHNKGHTCNICNYRTIQTPVFIKHMLTRHPDQQFDPSLLQNTLTTTDTILNEPPQQIIANSIIPATAQLYTLNPMILNIPNAQNMRAPTDHIQSNPNVAVTQEIVTNHGTINYQPATLVPTLNFYWGTHS